MLSNADSFLQSGVSPLEILFQNIIGTELSDTVAYRSVVRVNSLELGVLMPEQYTSVAERNHLCLDLFYWNFSHMFHALSRAHFENSSAGWASLHVPSRALVKTDLAAKLDKLMDSAAFTHPERICLEFADDILFEDLEPLGPKLDALRERGFLIGLADFGGEFCPVLKLADFAPDYVWMDPYVTACLQKDKTGVTAPAFEAVTECGARIIAADVETDMLRELFDIGCWGAGGKGSGTLKRRI